MFVNEIKIYSEIKRLETEFQLDFLYPKFIDSNCELFNLEFIDGTKGWNKDLIIDRKIIQALTSFTNLKVRKYFVIRFLSFIRNPYITIIKGMMKLVVRLDFYFLKILIFILIKYKFKFKNEIHNDFLIHSDCTAYQNVISVGKELYFIDFESTIFTKDFFLIDIVSMSIDYNKLRNLDSDWLNSFLIADYVKKNHHFNSKSRLNLQIYLCILRKMINLPQTDFDYILLRKFLIDKANSSTLDFLY